MDRFKNMAIRKAKEKMHFPDLPSSLKHDSVELNDLRKMQAARLADSHPYIHGYLGLRARLSQIWINRWTILLLLVLVRVLLLIGSLNDNIGEAKLKALSACTKVEDIGSAMASMPHYLSVGVNELSAKGIEKMVHGMVSALQLAVTVIQSLILFVINMMTSTYVCLATVLIHGSLEVTSEVIKKLTDKMNDAVDSIADGISSDAKSIGDKINDITKDIESSIFGSVIPDFPKVDFSGAVDKLKNLDIDTSGLTSDLDTLNKNIPTFDEVKNFTESAIAIPFDLIKKSINESLGGFTFDRDVFPLAQKQQLTFCSDNDNINGFFGNLYETARIARIVFIVLLSIAAVLVCVPMAWIEIKRWRRQQEHARMMEQEVFDSMDMIYVASRPMTATWGIKLGNRFAGKRRLLVRWAVAYGTTLPAIFVLSLALAGFFSCLCQVIMLKAIEKQVPELAQQVGEFANDVVSSLEGVSESWAQDANSVIVDFNDEINNDMLGFVQDGTTAVNDTLNTFTREMGKAIDSLFGDSILKKPAEDVVRCLIGLKVEAVQKGLTFIHDQAHVDLPLFDKDTFSLGAAQSISGDSDLTTFLASPSSITTDEVTGAVKHVTDALRQGIIQEAILSTALLLIYIIVVLIGVTRMLVGMAMPEKTRAEGGIRPAYFTQDRGAHDPFSDAYAEATSGHAAATGATTGADDQYTRGIHDEKHMHSVHGGKAQTMQGHTRESSHGHLGTTSKFI